ncbi:SIR2 family NAD-dependent protein deacylase [Hydrogenimonas cancrithermarum]|uniref:protein acetyllysine N-acetyltransferase n=1 Tax=Hydrogenimonas cancrithermarum TaxID=2993563 RepID=A0ABN6WZX5_9BACT|nr:Sir2 family NAD-dependent protein deacetylase [Hydrogenimonas cancrithermarum]BDY13882.1 NAD-dependent protein deacetylase [Hydrogenimonas cancrithermarum]
MYDDIARAREIVKEADAVLITAGAGMGVDSGLPDFRGKEGFWKAYPPVRKLGLSFSEMASPHWFETDSQFAWAFYGHRLHLYRDTTPHEGFEILLDLVNRKEGDYFIYTSNVDGQFQKAGFDEKKIVEIHGSIHHLQCARNCRGRIWPAEGIDVEVDMTRFEALNIPLCPDCGGVARPNILMFGDWYWKSRRTNRQEMRYNVWFKNVLKNSKKLVIIEIGAGTKIATIRSFGNALAKNYMKATLIRINPVENEVDDENGVGLRMGGLEGLMRLKGNK